MDDELETDELEVDEEEYDDSEGEFEDEVDDESTEIDESTGDDAWAWAKDLDAEKVEKTWNKFTQEWQDVAAEREKLAPASKLMQAMQDDPGLIRAVESYYNTAESDRTVEDKLVDVQSELKQYKTQVAVEKEIASVEAYAAEKGFPKPDVDGLLAHASKNRLGNLKAAYNDLYIDQISEAKKEAAMDSIKRSRKAKSVAPKGGGGKATGFSKEQISDMTPEEFVKSFGAIKEQYGK